VVLGADCWLQNHVTLAGPMTAGAQNKFYACCSIGQQTQDLKYQGEPTYLEIGDENTFREFVTVNRSTTSAGKTRIGSRGNFLAYSHIGHDCTVGNEVVFSNNGTLAGHVQVGDNAVMGGLTAVHQFCRIGRFDHRRLFENRAGRSAVYDRGWKPGRGPGCESGGDGAQELPGRPGEADQGSVPIDLSL